jgi:hypothetical protein
LYAVIRFCQFLGDSLECQRARYVQIAFNMERGPTDGR